MSIEPYHENFNEDKQHEKTHRCSIDVFFVLLVFIEVFMIWLILWLWAAFAAVAIHRLSPTSYGSVIWMIMAFELFFSDICSHYFRGHTSLVFCPPCLKFRSLVAKLHLTNIN
jgi:hypothetical protein